MSDPADGYVVVADPALVDPDVVWAFLSTEAYWGRWRTREDVVHQIRGAWRVVGAYRDGAMVGFARAVSDGAGLAYLADVSPHPASPHPTPRCWNGSGPRTRRASTASGNLRPVEGSPRRSP